MPVPTSPIGISDIYTEANGGLGAQTPVSELFKLSYFEGPQGNATINYHSWGQYGNTVGADRIYGLSAKNTNLLFGEYRGLTYFYNQSTYAIPLGVTNNLGPPGPPGFYINDVNVDVYMWDSTMTYFYANGGVSVPFGSYQPTLVDSPSSPIIRTGYWQIMFNTGPQLNPAALADLTINGNTKFTNLSLTPGGTTTADWNTYGSELVANYTSGRYGLSFAVTIH